MGSGVAFRVQRHSNCSLNIDPILRRAIMTIQDSASTNAGGQKDPLAAHWNDLSSSLCTWWEKLTEEDVARIAGHKARLVRLLQEKYGYTPERATREVNHRLQEYQDNAPSLAQSAATSPNFGEPAENAARTVLDANEEAEPSAPSLAAERKAHE